MPKGERQKVPTKKSARSLSHSLSLEKGDARWKDEEGARAGI